MGVLLVAYIINNHYVCKQRQRKNYVTLYEFCFNKGKFVNRYQLCIYTLLLVGVTVIIWQIEHVTLL